MSTAGTVAGRARAAPASSESQSPNEKLNIAVIGCGGRGAGNLAAVAGVLFVGSEGMLMADFNRRKLFPESKFADFQPPEPTIPDSPGHHREWITACKTGGPTTCSFDYSGALSEAALLGSVAFRTGKRLQWDAASLRAPNCPEADKLLRRDYRQGWTL